MDIVINSCFGGFSITRKALDELCRRGNATALAEAELCSDDYSCTRIKRNDPDLIDVVRSMGGEASGPFSNLKIITIPDDVDWIIEEYDGFEHVAERHRTWP